MNDICQEAEESLEYFAYRPQELTADHNLDEPDSPKETLATNAFWNGGLGKRAALVALNKVPETLEQAVQYIRSAIANKNVIMGGIKSDVKRVTFSEAIEKESGKADPGNWQGRRKKSMFSEFEKRLRRTEDDLSQTKLMVKKIMSV